MHKRKSRFLTLAAVLLALQAVTLIAPAYACGCGAMVTDRSSRMGVEKELSVVRWDGRTEQIVMRFTVNGDAPRAAWIMPVPTRATVELGDPDLFGDLARRTLPERKTRHYFWPREGDWPFSTGTGDGAAAAPMPGSGAPVGVVGREQLGDFDVARLTATDPDALRNWLTANGFELPPGLAAELRPYVEQQWEYVAVRLAPREPGRMLRGTLDPLRIRFASDRLVYPMRLSRLARTPQALGLYVLADHRMEPRDAIGGGTPEVTFAGRVEPEPSDPLAALTDGRPAYLTAVEQDFPRPAAITGDHELVRTPADTPFRRTTYTDALLTVGPGVPAWLLTVASVLVAATAAAVTLRRRKTSRRAAGQGRPA
ncbi:DUF2330 domain-containing protein [Streptomyces sp. NPDC051211]|uniref:DUF2330 domain-containing protein n=1 Tax=Streptomyces sp. NPDC051211 TaxID=3154643 RepID=UPI00344DC661